LICEYDGTNFSGWQYQSLQGERTVQGEIEKALRQILGEHIRLIGAGRTDTGVHAIEQVSNFRTRSRVALKKIGSGLNGVLPVDIRVKSTFAVDLNFNSRNDAVKRKYQYVISTKPTAIYRNYSWYFPYPFSFPVIQKISKYILGRHDFSAFCKAKSLRENNECRVTASRWKKRSDFIIYEIEADRFLHHMVRSLVGTMLKVSQGKMGPERFRNLLVNKNRNEVGKTAPPQGLFLKKIYYHHLKIG
jgi:tRNA pseudouridine38-40 synthase